MRFIGYVINYKRDHGDWEEIHIDSKTDTYSLRNLWCGTKYQLYMTAYNKIGTGLPCDIVTAYTKGSGMLWQKYLFEILSFINDRYSENNFFAVPVSPVGLQQGMTYNTTAASVWLDMWNDGGCSILYFIIEYKKEVDTDWKVSSKPVSPSDRIYVISDLTPATRYQLRITAHNNIGSTIQVNNFTTFNEEGGTYIVKNDEFSEESLALISNFMKSDLPISVFHQMTLGQKSGKIRSDVITIKNAVVGTYLIRVNGV